MPFKSLGLLPELVQAIHYKEPSPIQKQAISIVLSGKDLMAAAQTGTGKTAAFTLPVLQRLTQSKASTRANSPRALILTPTRELAAQVNESVLTYGQHLPLKSVVVFGGVKIGPQISRIRRGVDILVATPGRLLDLIEQQALSLSSIEILVLDEADRMLDMGFINDIRKVLNMLPKQRQTLLFSATFSPEIRALANNILNSPALVEVAQANATAEGIKQLIHPVDRGRKAELLSSLIRNEQWEQALVFTRTKHGADRLVKQLELDGITATAIHGNKSQNKRTRALADFKDGEVRILVATDIAARGLDIDKLPHVVNFDLPDVPEDYVHRIGRTGRAKNQGSAISLVCIDEKELLQNIERILKQNIPQKVIAGFEPNASIKAEPIHKRPQQRQRTDRPAFDGEQRRRHSSAKKPELATKVTTKKKPRRPGVADPRAQDTRAKMNAKTRIIKPHGCNRGK